MCGLAKAVKILIILHDFKDLKCRFFEMFHLERFCHRKVLPNEDPEPQVAGLLTWHQDIFFFFFLTSSYLGCSGDKDCCLLLSSVSSLQNFASLGIFQSFMEILPLGLLFCILRVLWWTDLNKFGKVQLFGFMARSQWLPIFEGKGVSYLPTTLLPLWSKSVGPKSAIHINIY